MGATRPGGAANGVRCQQRPAQRVERADIRADCVGLHWDRKQLDTFVRMAELGSFTRTAAVRRVAQPALSRQIRALEVKLHPPLFDRNGRGVTLTPAGARLLVHGR